MFLGTSGTGKSTILKYLRQFFRIENGEKPNFSFTFY